ncbi:MAG: hypothetical protein ACRCTI_11960, partial [Beijerinckiaceae bacterium]
MTRLALASLRPTPRGIERVDFALVRRLCQHWTGDLFGLFWTPWGMRVFDRSKVAALVGHVSQLWRQQAQPDEDPIYRSAAAWIAGEAAFSPEPKAPALRHHLSRARRGLDALRSTGASRGDDIRSLPSRTIVASFGHLGLALPGLEALLKLRPDITLASLIHDIVSLTDPQFFPEKNGPFFRRIFERAAAPGNIVLTTTDFVRGQVEALQGGAPNGPTVRRIDI